VHREAAVPIHDWTRIHAGIFHDFHLTWIGEIKKALNEGVLPEEYYALAEQHAGFGIADVLTLHKGPEESGSSTPGGLAVATAPPRVSRRETVEQAVRTLRRTIAIRHVSDDRLVALLEITSPSNKDRRQSVDDFVAKACDALDAGVHLLLLDLFPPGPSDPDGLHAAIIRRLQRSDETYDLPSDMPLIFASYAAGEPIEVYLENLAVGSPVTDMPLFLKMDRYITAPLRSTYDVAYASAPSKYREILEKH
jgi:hypothetical protein